MTLTLDACTLRSMEPFSSVFLAVIVAPITLVTIGPPDALQSISESEPDWQKTRYDCHSRPLMRIVVSLETIN